ncbi:MAG: HD domain-containing protein [Planctomycetota bacterium]
MHFPHAIRDPIHGYIRLTEAEVRGIDTPEVQRLRGISQLGLTERVYPGARHSRFEHALGCLEVATRIFEELRGRIGIAGLLTPLGLPAQLADYQALLAVVRWVGLLHDLGHAPFSHVSEDLLPMGQSHEHLTVEMVSSGAVGEVLRQTGENLYEQVIQILHPASQDLPPPLAFAREVISGPLGADRMDYLLRDSAATGVSYGIFDLGRILHTLQPAPSRGGVRLGILRGGVLAAEGLLWGRISMFQQVYFHRTRRILDVHLRDFLRVTLPQGTYPGEISDYLQWNDARVWEMLRTADRDSTHPGHRDAQRILRRWHHRALPQELEANDPEKIAGWLQDWRARILEVAPSAEPVTDLLYPPPESESGADLEVVQPGGEMIALREVSSLVGRLRQRPLGRMYVARGVDSAPGFLPSRAGDRG